MPQHFLRRSQLSRGFNLRSLILYKGELRSLTAMIISSEHQGARASYSVAAVLYRRPRGTGDLQCALQRFSVPLADRYDDVYLSSSLEQQNLA